MFKTATSPLSTPDQGRVKAIFAADVALARGQVLDELKSQREGPSIVTITWEKVPELQRELNGLVDAIAEAALSIWPLWYRSAAERFRQASDTATDVVRERDIDEVVLHAKSHAPTSSEAWLRHVWKRCERGRLPTTKKLTSAEQVRHLSKAVDPHHLIIVVAALRPIVKKGRLQALAKALEWMAKETASPLVFIAPAEWNSRPELDAISYDCVPWDDPSRNLPSQPSGALSRDTGPIPDPTLIPLEKGGEPANSPGGTDSSVVVEPVLGKPHPKSRVENHLAKHLTADPELAPLFRWNHPMPVLGIGKTVDLFWEAGGVVIEIDGPSHLTPPQYNQDRDRDYRLLLEGYTSLRITNDAVNADVAVVIEKIRKVVRLKNRN
jgi:very-short-patch-repair endonuclease